MAFVGWGKKKKKKQAQKKKTVPNNNKVHKYSYKKRKKWE